MSYADGTLPGIDLERSATVTPEILQMSQGKLPTSFPMQQWVDQARRYQEYWSWFNGDELNKVSGKTKTGETVYKFPLHINSIRNFSRKHAAILLGEAADTPRPLIAAQIDPKLPLSEEPSSKSDILLGKSMENAVNMVWTDSYGRAAQITGATLQQFLGGTVFQLVYVPHKEDELTIPLLVRGLPADFCMPVWGSDDPWWLHEMFVLYRITGAVARHQYGVDTEEAWVVYCEHWTKDSFSIYVDGEPLQSNFSGEWMTYRDQENPFGFVPFVYIPRVRETLFYGSSLVEDVRGLVREYNARLADQGDAIHDSVHRKRYMRNVHQTPKEKQIAAGVWVTDLGVEPPTAKSPPDVYSEDPPEISVSLTDFARQTLWNQLLRESALGPIAFGEDEGSQRSALTLAFRMWPATAQARITRTFWTDGLNVLAIMILRMMRAKGLDRPLGLTIPKDFRKRFAFSQNWNPMIPRDREQLINEVVLLKQAGLKSRISALKQLDDVRNPTDEERLIQADLTFEAALQAPAEPGSQEGAPEDVQTPVASSGLSERE